MNFNQVRERAAYIHIYIYIANAWHVSLWRRIDCRHTYRHEHTECVNIGNKKDVTRPIIDDWVGIFIPKYILKRIFVDLNWIKSFWSYSVVLYYVIFFNT